MNVRLSLLIFGYMLVAAILAWVLIPRQSMEPSTPDLETMIPIDFGDWRRVDDELLVMALAPRQENEDGQAQVYDQTVMRSYRNAQGDSVMLAVAYGKEQRQEVKIHRPELCYISQGFKVLSKSENTLRTPLGTIRTVRLITSDGRRLEPVTYWVRMGERFVTDAFQSRLLILAEGLLNNIPDGIVVRVSTSLPLMDGDIDRDFRLHERFLLDMLSDVDAASRYVLLGESNREDQDVKQQLHFL